MTLTSIPMFSPEFNLERKLCNTSVLSSHTAITTEITKLLAPQKNYIKKCKTFFTSSTDDFSYYGFVRRVKEITETFQDISCDQIRVRHLDDENC